ncbi:MULTISPECIES: arylesterase [unclassified Oceanobacter]|uniref:arylesterase n=1 Tax=unclassified Oceanobacter TaxID=2620260 RepID=UPI002734E1EA|nr:MULTISPECIES: arylesterase [unclassified Oceanobacter]MDP2505209.1 arylesterase [Oceanobacter sp. 3_MG-2023]MDP2549194.1 arylesterase [Oceanobacter sp. 4_MG-2023]MDP2608017.1 arylesterase [Oceanobacter sp. 1_MG-2023]MDP2611321.1 arylesterase [Oceanobacter sp. 2_MG-2023]
MSLLSRMAGIKILLVGLVVLTGLPSWAEPIDTGHSKNPVVLVIGDSISAGFGVPVQQGWVTLFQQQLQQRVPHVTVVNASISGDTTQGGVARLPALIQSHQPDLLIIELGGNDGLRGTPLSVIRSNLERMITMAEHEGIMVMLLGMQIPPNYGSRYTEGFANIYSELANQQETLLLPFLLEGIATQPELMQADGIHPATAAQPMMSTAVIDALDIWIQFVNNEL